MVERLGCTGPCGDVVEFGCGYGTFTLPVTRNVEGKVHAPNIESEMVAATGRKATEAGLMNVAERRDFVAEGCGRPDGSAGYAAVFNILHIEDPVALLREAHRVLSPGGWAGIIHWKHDPATPRGPSLDIRPTSEQCRTWAEQAGFRFVRAEDLCCCSWHWGLVVERPEDG